MAAAEPFHLAPEGGPSVFERFFLRYSELAPDERGVDAFARIARETQGMEVLGPPLAAAAAS